MKNPMAPNAPTPSPTRKPCRVLLVDQSLRFGDSARPLFETGEVVQSGDPATFGTMLNAVVQQRPDVVVVELSGDGAFRAIESVMAERPTPILVLHPKSFSKSDTFRALALGALDVLERPEQPPRDYW